MELIENRNINEDDGFVKEWVQKLSNGQPNSLRVFIESLGLFFVVLFLKYYRNVDLSFSPFS